MNDMESTPNQRSRRSRMAVPFVAGAVAGAALFGGSALVIFDGGSSAGGSTSAAATSRANVALAAPALSAEQIYRLDSPGVVDITVATQGSPAG